MERIEYVSVDKDVLDFFKVIYFGAITDPMAAASDRAYRDLNRTIRFKKMPQEQRDLLRQSVTELFKKEIPTLVERGVDDQISYDSWHHRICREIRTYYRDAGIEFFYGQAQKWLNMTMKYLYVSGEYTFDGLFQYLHIPIDNYVFSVAKKELGIPQPTTAWSRWDDYNRQYMAYQTALRSNIRGYYPLRWEFKFWMKEARQLEQTATTTKKHLGKLQVLETLLQSNYINPDQYYAALERIGDLKNHYYDYMITEPINCDKELERLPEADYDLCCALLTMLLREDHFSNGSFDERYQAGQVQPILQRMIDLLSQKEVSRGN